MNRRTSFITAAAVTAVVLAGTTAVAANIGILSAADSDNVGELSATTVVTQGTVEPQVVDVYIEDPVSPSTTPTTTFPLESPAVSTTVQEFAVDSAGTVSVDVVDGRLVVAGVTAADGWSWSGAQASDTQLSVTFTSGDVEYVFVADLAADGTVAARVDQPIVNVVHVPAATAPSGSTVNTAPGSSSYDDDDHDDDDHDDHDDHDDDDHDDDDDDHEYEGGDDDD